MLKKFAFSVLLGGLVAVQAQANQNESPVIASAVITKPVHALSGNVEKKDVYLMPVHLTTKQKQVITNYPTNKLSAMHDTSLPSRVDLGMDGVPVLDQGRHGSCVTFAATAAIDALLGKGDYISQLCNLELGSYLENRGYYPSGWNGSTSTIVLNQIQEFGYINKDNQKNKFCGMVDYPKDNESNEGTPLSLDGFKLKSESFDSFNSEFYTESMFTLFQRDDWTPENLGAEKMIIKIKKFLVEKEDHVKTRLIFSVLLPINHCSAGACAHYHATNDTWALTDAIKNDSDPILGGHQMILIGYDNDAIATDEMGKKHQGLFILRNSWGDDVGDNGNYYMTYEFFKQFVMDMDKLYLFMADKQH